MRARSLVSLCGILVSVAAVAAEPGYDFVFNRDSFRAEPNGGISSVLFSEPGYYERFEKDRAQYSDYASFLKYLRAKHPAFFEQAVLMHHSNSLQPASFEFPRAILMSKGTFVTFAEHPDQGDRRRVEMIETMRDASVKFRELEFGPQGVKLNPAPQSCVACHGSPARPIWDPYDAWPLAYGSTIGRFGSDKELAAYRSFIAKNGKKGVYASLDFKKLETLLPGEKSPQLHFNEKITQDVLTINAVQWAKALPSLETNPGRYLLVAAAACSFETPFEEALPEYLPAPLAAEMKSRWQTARGDTDSARTRFKNGLVSAYASYFPGFKKIFAFNPGTPERLPEAVETTTAFRLALEPFGLNHFALTSPHSYNDYLTTAPGNDILVVAQALYYARPALFDGLEASAPMNDAVQSPVVTVNCDLVKKASRRALSKMTVAGLQPTRSKDAIAPQAGKSILSNCMNCHVQNRFKDDPYFGTAPFIPFDDPAALGKKIRENASFRDRVIGRITRTDDRRMPPNATLSPDDIAAVKAFLDVIATP